MDTELLILCCLISATLLVAAHLWASHALAWERLRTDIAAADANRRTSADERNIWAGVLSAVIPTISEWMTRDSVSPSRFGSRLADPGEVELSMNTEYKIIPGSRCRVAVSIQSDDFEPHRLVLHNLHPHRWQIDDIFVNGIRRMSDVAMGIPGQCLAAPVGLCLRRMGRVSHGGEIAVEATYVGDLTDGEPLVLGMIGQPLQAIDRQADAS